MNHQRDTIYKKLRQNPVISFSTVGHFEKAANMVAILKNEVDEDASRIERMSNTKNGVKIRCRLGGVGAQTDTPTRTDRMKKSLPLNPQWTLY